MSDTPPAIRDTDRRDRVIDVLSRLVGVVVFGSLLAALAYTAWRKFEAAGGRLADPVSVAEQVSVIADLLFLVLLIVLFVVRHRPVRKHGGFVPRAVALVAGLGLPYVVLLPRFVNPTATYIAAGLAVAGNAVALVTLAYLGRSFSILPEARRLVTTGPYAIVRHPLYLAEETVIIGMILNHLHWISVTAGIAHLGLQILRMGWEERVLTAAFPQYDAYRSRVKRFIPGIW